MYKKIFDNNGLEEKMVQHQVGQLIELSRSLAGSPEKEISSDQAERVKELIEKSGTEEWIFYASAALFSMNIGTIIKDHNRMGRINLTTIVTKELNKVNPKLIKAIGDFRDFTTEHEYNEDQHVANIGLWVVWNLMKKKPERDDYDLVTAIGHLQVKRADKVRESLFHSSLN